MSRKPREIAVGEYYHVLSRGNNKQTLFYEAGDFEYYLQTLGRYQVKFGISLFHYCLMTNHVHLLLRNDRSPQGVTKLMHGLQTVYAAHFKKRHGTTGHVFEDRFKHLHIESESYLLECGRYIERNPLRAQMVREAGEYPWSSYSFYAFGRTNRFLTPDPLYSDLAAADRERRRQYREYVETPRPYEIIVDRFFDERILTP